MTTIEQIKVLCVRMDISISELVMIADELNISYEQVFTLPNGEKIELKNGGTGNA